jgi:hypothetical protein
MTTKSVRLWRVDETWLLPPSVEEFVPAGHPAHLIRDIVCEESRSGPRRGSVGLRPTPRAVQRSREGKTESDLQHVRREATRRMQKGIPVRMDV